MLLLYFILFIILVLYFIVEIIRNPTYGLIPYNKFVEYISDKKVFYSQEEKNKIFPTSLILEKHWRAIRKEALNVMGGNIQNVGRKFIIEDEDFWKGWRTYPLRMFGKDNKINIEKCPIMKQILTDHPDILTAFFSLIEPGKTLPSHYGPFKGILRYHLGLLVPPKEAGNCLISVDGEIYEWREGEGVLFDETYKHFVLNETQYPRIVLFIDVKRPFDNMLMRIINDMIIWTIGVSPYNK